VALQCNISVGGAIAKVCSKTDTIDYDSCSFGVQVLSTTRLLKEQGSVEESANRKDLDSLF